MSEIKSSGTSREKLILAMIDLLWETGYSATSPSAIQKRAGVGQGPMYHHFTNKAGLARAALDRVAAQMSADVDTALGTSGPPMDRLLGYLRLERLPMRGCRLGRLAQEPEVVSNPDLCGPIKAFFSSTRERLEAVIQEGVAAGEFSAEVAPETLAALIVAAIQGAYVDSRAEQDPALFTLAITGLTGLLQPVHTRPDVGR